MIAIHFQHSIALSPVGIDRHQRRGTSSQSTPSNCHICGDHLQWIENSGTDERAEAAEILASLLILNIVLADQISRSAGQKQARQVAQQSRGQSREEPEYPLILIDLNDRAEDGIVFGFLADELGHHPDRHDVEWLGNDDPGSVDHQVPLQLTLESLLVLIIVEIRVWELFLVHLFDS